MTCDARDLVLVTAEREWPWGRFRTSLPRRAQHLDWLIGLATLTGDDRKRTSILQWNEIVLEKSKMPDTSISEDLKLFGWQMTMQNASP